MIERDELLRLLAEGWEIEQPPESGWFTYLKPVARKNGETRRVKRAALKKVLPLLALDERKSHLVWKLKEGWRQVSR